MFIRHFTANENQSVSEALRTHLKLTPEESDFLIEWGAVYLNKERIEESFQLQKGDYLRVHTKPRRFAVPDWDWNDHVLLKRTQYLVVNKPAGLPTHATVDNRIENLLHQLRLAFGHDHWVTQRLDQETQGTIVIARTKKFQAQFNQWLSDRRVTKRYRALVSQAPSLGQHRHFMKPSPRAPKTITEEPVKGWQECLMTVKDVQPYAGGFLVDLTLDTGRTHQIRAQLGKMRCGIWGDRIYGREKKKMSELALQAYSVSFPEGQVEKTVTAPIPDSWVALHESHQK